MKIALGYIKYKLSRMQNVELKSQSHPLQKCTYLQKINTTNMKPFPHVNKRSDHGEIQEATAMGSSIDEGHHFFNSVQLKDKDERERERCKQPHHSH
jgi:hypothetical protein